MEEALAFEEEPVDVIAVNGEMDKEEKFSFIRSFTTATSMPHFNPHVLVATAVANTGVDQEDLVHVSRVGIPRCVLTGKQESGRNARKAGMTGVYNVYLDWKAFANLIISILSPSKLESSAATDYDGLNTVISPSLYYVATKPNAHLIHTGATTSFNNVQSDVIAMQSAQFLVAFAIGSCISNRQLQENP